MKGNMIGEQNEWKKNDRRMGRRKVSEMSLYKGDSKSAREIEREWEWECETDKQTDTLDRLVQTSFNKVFCCLLSSGKSVVDKSAELKLLYLNKEKQILSFILNKKKGLIYIGQFRFIFCQLKSDCPAVQNTLKHFPEDFAKVIIKTYEVLSHIEYRYCGDSLFCKTNKKRIYKSAMFFTALNRDRLIDRE